MNTDNSNNQSNSDGQNPRMIRILDIASTSKELNLLLKASAYAGELQSVMNLLKKGADPCMKGKKKGPIIIKAGFQNDFNPEWSAIELAALNNHGDIVKKIIKHIGHVPPTPKLFIFFIHYQNTDMISYLLSKNPGQKIFTKYDEYLCKSILDQVIKSKDLELFKRIIERIPDINSNDVVHTCHSAYENSSFANFLLEKKYNINNFYPGWDISTEEFKFFEDNISNGYTFKKKAWRWCLSMCCKEGNTHVVKILLDNGVDHHDRTNLPYKYAAENGQIECLKLLHDKEPDFFNNKEFICELLGSASKHINIIEYIDSIGLLSNDPNPFLKACMEGSIDLVKLYVEKGIDFRAQNDYGIRICLFNRNIELGEYLYSIGCDPTSMDNFVAYWAQCQGASEVLEFLDKNNISYPKYP